MPFESESQRRFLFARHPKIAEEFAKATPKGADLPEHVKHAADGGMIEKKDDVADKKDDISTKPEESKPKEGDEFTEGIRAGVNHDSDAVRSYLSSKLHQLLHPTMEGDGMAEGGPVMRSELEHQTPNAMMARAMSEGGYAEGGYPHVTFLENVGFPEVKKTVHLDNKAPANIAKASAGHSENYAEGGYPHVTFLENVSPAEVQKTVHLEPRKPMPTTTTETGEKENPEHMAEGGVSDDEKRNTIYKAMGIKKYADGGPVIPTAVPEAPGAGLPSPQDPTYWEQVKAALAKLSAPVTAPASAVSGIANAVAPVVAPAAISATNKLTGLSLPVPPSPAPKIEDLGAPAPMSAAMPPTVPPTAPPITPSPAAAPGPNVKGLFNQDTSKLTEGVNAEDRQKLASGMVEGQRSLGSIIAEAVSGLGDALAAKGGREQHSLQTIFGLQKQQRDEALANFDKARQDRLEKLDLQTKMGNNAINQLAAQDAYGSDEHLNKQLGAPPGTLHKDLPLYMQMMTASVAQQEKDAELYMKAHAQAASDVDNAIKNASVFNIKPSPAQIQASGAKLADQYFHRAKGSVLFQPSDGQKPLWIPAQNVQKAKQMDPNGQIIP